MAIWAALLRVFRLNSHVDDVGDVFPVDRETLTDGLDGSALKRGLGVSRRRDAHAEQVADGFLEVAEKSEIRAPPILG